MADHSKRVGSLTFCSYSKHVDTKRYEALARWSRELSVLHAAIVAKAANTGPVPANGPPDFRATRTMGNLDDFVW